MPVHLPAQEWIEEAQVQSTQKRGKAMPLIIYNHDLLWWGLRRSR